MSMTKDQPVVIAPLQASTAAPLPAPAPEHATFPADGPSAINFDVSARIRRAEDVLARVITQAVEALSRASFAHEPHTAKHMRRVALLAEKIARSLDLGRAAERTAYLGGLLHDVGKIGISRDVILATSRLLPEEFSRMRLHPEIGAQIVYGLDLDCAVQEAVRHHHERWDGTGYPDRLQGTRIPLSARIVAVADAIDAMQKGRAYSAPRGIEAVRAELLRCAGTQWDPDIVRAAVPLVAD
jgi:putative nucleotidyltransferase with HDIG domain